MSSRRARFGAALTGSEATTSSNSNLNPSQLARTPAPAPILSAPPNAADLQHLQTLHLSQQSDRARQSQKKSKSRGKALARAPIGEPGRILVDGKAVAVEITEDDDQLCFICAETVVYWAVGECEHRTCHTCAVRLRALYKRTECTFCKHDCPRVVFTVSPDLPFTSFPPSTTPHSDARLGLSFETREQMDDSLSLLRFNCPDIACQLILAGWGDLKRHTKKDHALALCDLCCLHKKIFAHEHTLFNNGALKNHMQKVHAPCDFCSVHFYDLDLLYSHCREKHEECFLCMRQGIKHQYYLNYNLLEAHFKAEHYLCPHPACLVGNGNAFVVFATELDLQAHSVAAHGTSFSDQKSRRDARRIETNFTYEEPPVPGPARGGRGRGGSSRAIEPPPPAEFVVGKRVIPGFGPTVNRDTRVVRGGNQVPEEPTPKAKSGANTPISSAAVSPIDTATLERHTVLMSRVSAILGSQSKIASFKSAIRGYRGNEMSAADLVDNLWNVFDRKADVASGIVTGVADLFEAGEKRMDLMRAWQDLRVEQNQFPTLAPNSQPNSRPGSALARPSEPNWAAASTTPYASTSRASIAPRERFPALGGPPGSAGAAALRANSNSTKSKSSSAKVTPWSASNSVTSATRENSRSISAPSASRSYVENPLPPIASPSLAAARRPHGGMEFPSLPSSSQEIDRRARVKAALGKSGPANITDEVGEFEHYDPANWGSGSGVSTRAGSPDYGNGTGSSSNGNGQMAKKKKAKPILLMSHSVHRG